MGKSLALLLVAFSQESVATYSSILEEQAVVRQQEHKQFITSNRVKIGGKLLHQHLLPSGVSPQLVGVPQVEQFLILMLFIS